MELTDERAAEIQEEIRQLALSLIASGRVDPTKEEPSYRLLVEAYKNYSEWVAKAGAVVTEATRESYRNFGKHR